MNSVAIAPAYIHSSVKRRKNTWYSIASGNWSDPNIWLSNERKRWNYPGQNIYSPIFPRVGDDVYINHSVTYNLAGTFLTINNLYVSGSLLVDNSTGKGLIVRGDIQATGTINLTTSQAFNLTLYGVNNYVTSFTCGTISTVTYARTGDQQIMPLIYRNLTTTGSGAKYYSGIGSDVLGTFTSNFSSAILQSNSVISGSIFSNTGTFDLGVYDLTVTGTTLIYTGLSKTGSGSLLFIGLFTTSVSAPINFSGNPTVECRGGIAFSSAGLFTSGTGAWSFTTNNQTATFSNSTSQFNGVVNVAGGITLTQAAGAGVFQINNSLNGTVAGSAYINKGTLNINTDAGTIMATGSYNYTSFANTVAYVWAGGNVTLPSIANYYGLTINGAVTKTLAVNTILSGALGGTGTLDISSFNIEAKNGSSIATMLGSGIFTLSTNNQTLSGVYTPNILISGAITVTSALGLNSILIGSVNGNNAASTFDNRTTGAAILQYQNAVAPMVTGVLQVNAAANTWLYNKAGAQDITGGTYRTLTLAGSGVKTLQGNVVVATLYTLTAPATLNLNSYTRT